MFQSHFNSMCEFQNLYSNSVTFYHQTPTGEIPHDKLLVLDNYAFDVDELVSYFEHSLKNIFRNPHITEEGKNSEFSDAAKTQLREHPILGIYVQQYEAQINNQKLAIVPETVAKVITMLNCLFEQTRVYFQVRHQVQNYVGGSDDAVQAFSGYMDTLSQNDRNTLENYIIRAPMTFGGTQNLLFKDALQGGYDNCILTTQIFLWFFVREFRPDHPIPTPVIELAQRHHFSMGGPFLAVDSNPSSPLFHEQTNEDDDALSQELIQFLQMLALQILLRFGPNYHGEWGHTFRLTVVGNIVVLTPIGDRDNHPQNLLSDMWTDPALVAPNDTNRNTDDEASTDTSSSSDDESLDDSTRFGFD